MFLNLFYKQLKFINIVQSNYHFVEIQPNLNRFLYDCNMTYFFYSKTINCLVAPHSINQYSFLKHKIIYDIKNKTKNTNLLNREISGRTDNFFKNA